MEQPCCGDVVPTKKALNQSYLVRRGSMPGEKILVTTTEARQGVTGNNVRYVLVWSIAGAIVALVIVYFLFFR
jgi:hypothetical protein